MDIQASNLYEANKQLIKNTEQPLTHPQIAGAERQLETYFEEQIKQYAMLLCHDQRDYTIFHLDPKSGISPHMAANECIGCCMDRGTIYSIEKTEDNLAYEIWIEIENTMYCYYLFPYDEAVIECK